MYGRHAWLALGLVVLVAAALAIPRMSGSTEKSATDAPSYQTRSARIELGEDVDLDELDWDALWLKATEAVRLPPSQAEIASIGFEHDPQGSLERWAISGSRADGWKLSLAGQWSRVPRGEMRYLEVQAIDQVDEGTLYYSPLPSVAQALAALEDLDWSAALPLQVNGPVQAEDIAVWECRPGMAPLEVTLASKAFVWSGNAFRPLKPTGTKATSTGQRTRWRFCPRSSSSCSQPGLSIEATLPRPPARARLEIASRRS